MFRLMKILGVLIALFSLSLFETTSLFKISFGEFLIGTSAVVSDVIDDLVTPSKRVPDYQREPLQPTNRSDVNTRSRQQSGLNVSRGPTPKKQLSESLPIECPSEYEPESSGALIYESTLPSITDEGVIIGYPDEPALTPLPAPLPVGTVILESAPTPIYCYDCGDYYYY